ncbi:MAG TPA: beta-xylosidase [Verrucomicrobiae bacterium]|nr:beta-xylosidase [Verrucomicrobiae bacterium]
MNPNIALSSTRHLRWRSLPLVAFRCVCKLVCGLALIAPANLTAAEATNSPAVAADGVLPVTISIDASKPIGPMKPVWRFFGADEPNYAYMKDGKRLIRELGVLRPKDVYFRAHNLLSTGDGTPAYKWGSSNAYTEDENGKPVYDWTILDRIFDAYLERNVRPYAQIGFMPKALSIQPEPYQHEWRPGLRYESIATGWSYPPKDYAKWAELVFQWVTHCVERYGKEEVEKWYWEVWNEPNLRFYWQGTPDEFYKLHDFAIDAVRRALPTARVGGPDVAGAGGRFMEGFLRHVISGTNYATGKRGTPTDFLAFHAKGSPRFVDGHVRLGCAPQLTEINRGFALIASFPEMKNTPIVIGESDPDGCAACQGPHLGYRNTTMYSSYTAATFARKYELADRHGVNLEGALTWAFEFEDQPYFAGQRVLANNGLDLPVMNVFRMFSHMSGQRVEAKSSASVALDDILRRGVAGPPDISALASVDSNKVAVMIWYYHDDDLPGPDAQIDIKLNHLALGNGEARLTHYRIDGRHSNSFAVWKSLGSPTAPNESQYDRMLRAGRLTQLHEPQQIPVEGQQASVRVQLPRQGVSLLLLEKQ